MSDYTNTTGTGDAVRAILAAGAQGAGGDIIDPLDAELGHIKVLPEGYGVHLVDVEAIRRKYATNPAAREGVYQVQTTESFIDYFGQHRGDNGGQVWADLPNQIVGVIDAAEENTPSFERHRVILRLQTSPEWQAWTRASGQYASQEAFAEFLEGHRNKVIEPDAATLMEVVRSLSATTNVEFKSAVRGQDGQVQIRYEETTTAKAGRQADLEIPASIVLRLRVYVGEDPIEVPARLRYRIKGGELTIGVVIDAVEEYLELANETVVGRLNQYLDDTRVLIGVPAGAR